MACWLGAGCVAWVGWVGVLSAPGGLLGQISGRVCQAVLVAIYGKCAPGDLFGQISGRACQAVLVAIYGKCAPGGLHRLNYFGTARRPFTKVIKESWN